MFRDNIFRVLVFTIGFSAASWAKDPTPDVTPEPQQTSATAAIVDAEATVEAEAPQLALLPFE